MLFFVVLFREEVAAFLRTVVFLVFSVFGIEAVVKVGGSAGA